MKRLFLCVLGCLFAFGAYAASYQGGQDDTLPVQAYGMDNTGNIHPMRTDESGNMLSISGAGVVTRSESYQSLAADSFEYTTTYSGKTKIDAVLLTIKGSTTTNPVAITEDMTIIFDSKTGGLYDTTLAAETLSGESNGFWQPNHDLIIESGDQIYISITNATTPAATAGLTIIAEDLN